MKSLILAAVLATAATAAEPAVAQPAVGQKRGQVLFKHWCAPCHGAEPGEVGSALLPGTEALRLKYKGKVEPVLEKRTDLQPDYVKAIVRQGTRAMPFFRKTELSNAEVDAIARYLAQRPQLSPR